MQAIRDYAASHAELTAEQCISVEMTVLETRKFNEVHAVMDTVMNEAYQATSLDAEAFRNVGISVSHRYDWVALKRHSLPEFMFIEMTLKDEKLFVPVYVVLLRTGQLVPLLAPVNVLQMESPEARGGLVYDSLSHLRNAASGLEGDQKASALKLLSNLRRVLKSAA